MAIIIKYILCVQSPSYRKQSFKKNAHQIQNVVQKGGSEKLVHFVQILAEYACVFSSCISLLFCYVEVTFSQNYDSVPQRYFYLKSTGFSFQW